MNDKIFMHFPIEIEKGEDGTYKRVIVKGKASTPHQDKQGEWIDPMGCDIDDFKRISDDHIKGNSGTIGEIIKAHKDHEAVWIDEAELYPSLPQVQHIVKIADELKKRPNSKMQLSFSIEGSATERDSINPKRILKAKLTGAAVTLQPINSNATAELFAKSLNYDDTDFDALEKSDNIEQKRYLYEWKDSDGVECKLTKSFEIEKSQIHKYISKKPDGKGGWEYEYSEKDKHIKKLLNEATKYDLNFPGRSSSNGWKLSIQGKTMNDTFELYDKLHDFLVDENIAHKIATKKRVENTNKEQSKKLLTIYVPDDEKHLELAEKVYKKIKTYKGWYDIKTPTNYEHYAGGIFFRNDRNEAGEYIPATQKSTTAELEEDDSEDVLKKEELKKKTVSLIAKAVKEKRISKEKGKKMLKHFLNQ